MTQQEQPYRPDKRGAAVFIRRLVLLMPLVVPGIALAGGYWVFFERSAYVPMSNEALGLVLVVSYALLLVGCSLFAGWMASSDSDPEWRKQHWTDATMMAAMLQIVLTPVLAGSLIAFFLAGH